MTPRCEEDEPVEIQLSDVTMHPKGTPAPASSVEARVFEERVDLSNNMTWRQMIGVGVRIMVLARGELVRLEGPGYAARRTELRRKAKEAARTRDRQAAASQDETEENDATEEEMTRERTTRVGRPRGGMKVAARIGERLRREIGRGGRPRVGDGYSASHLRRWYHSDMQRWHKVNDTPSHNCIPGSCGDASGLGTGG